MACRRKGGTSMMTEPQRWQWHHPYPTPPAPTPTGSPMRRWLPATIIATGIVIAGAVIGAAVIVGGSSTRGANHQASVQEEAAPRSQTCVEWASTQVELRAIPPLPQGWDWSTPNIDTYIGNLATAVEKSVAVFEQRITPEPANAAAAAKAYIGSKRAEMKALRDHTYGSSAGDGTATDAALARLNQICGTTAD